MKTTKPLKTIFVWIILIISSSIFSQGKGITLENKETKKTIFILENERVKVKTTDGNTFFGHYQIIDSETISIDNSPVLLSSIVKIKQRSLIVAILRTICIVNGAILLTVGIAGVIAGGYAVLVTLIAVPPGLPLFIAPLTSNNHSNREWNYKISENIL